MSLLKKKCVFCRTDINDPVALGQMEKTKNIYGHYYCILLSATITQSGRDNQGIWGFMPKDILNEVGRCKRHRCFYCSRLYASLKCNSVDCHVYFHLPCGLRNKISIEFFDKYKTFCNKHRKKNGIPRNIRKSLDTKLCVICYEHLSRNDDESTVIWAPCCKTSVFHITCIRSMALNAGYFMKCPTCSNSDIFVDHLKKYSVFVPERDASWETESGAYRELLGQHFQCDADSCLCTSGRKFYKKGRGPWHIFKCELCGSQGVHRGCLTVPLNNNKFICAICKTIEGASSKDKTVAEVQKSVQQNHDEKSTKAPETYDGQNDANLGKLVLNDITNNNDRSPIFHFNDSSNETPGCSSDDEETKIIRHWERLLTRGLLIEKAPKPTEDKCLSKSILNENTFSSDHLSVGHGVAKRRFSERLKKKQLFNETPYPVY